jgi:hypothetical protein
MSSYNYSYNVLINRFEAFAAGHLLIKRFTHGQIDLSDQLNDDQYPFMHVTPDTIEPVKGAMQFGFHIMFADIPRDKETKAEYQREVISDCVRLGQDLIAEIQNGLELFGFNVQLVNNVVFEPFMEEQKNTVTGVAFTIKLEVPWDWSACDIPAVWAVGGESTGGSGSPIGLLLQVNGVNNVVQSELDLVAGTNITLTDNGDGSVTIDSTGGGGGGSGTVTSVGLTAPAAFNVSGSPVTTSGTLALTAAGNSSQYITGAGALQTFPTIPAPQVNSDWNAVSGVAQILNKPTIPSPQDLQGVTNIGNETTNTIIVKNVFGVQVKTSVNQVLVDAKPNGAGVEGEINIYSTTGFDPVTTYKRTGVNNILFPTSGTGTFALSVNGVTPNATTGDITISAGSGTVTSVGLTMPSAFSVAGSPVTTAGTLAVTGAGTTSQYVRGDGTLANFPSTGGGGGQIFYFNGNVSQGTIGGDPYYELGTAANTGPAANFTRATTGAIARFITDVGEPNHLIIPSGVWTIDVYLSETGGGSNNAEIVAKLYTYNGSTFTLVATSPLEQITNGNVPDLYTFSISVPNTVTAATDRIAIEFDIQNTNGKTVTLYTESNKIGEVHSTYAIGLSSLNGLTDNTQTFATGTAGTDFAISSAGSTHTFNLPTANATNRGALSSADWSTFNGKLTGNAPITGATATKITYDSKGLVTAGASLVASDLPTGIDATKIGTGNVSNTEFGYLDGVTSSIQTQIDNKKDTITYGQVYAAVVGASSTTYAAITGLTAFNATESNRHFAVPVSGIIKNFYVLMSGTQSATGTLVITLRNNATSSSVSVTISNSDGASPTKSDNINTLSVTAGDKISIQLLNNATTNSASVLSMAFIIERT